MSEVEAFFWTGRLGAGWLAAHGYVRAASDSGWKRIFLPGAWAFLGSWLGLLHLLFIIVRQGLYLSDASSEVSLGLGPLVCGMIFLLGLTSSIVAMLVSALTYLGSGTRGKWARALLVGILTSSLSPMALEALVALWP